MWGELKDELRSLGDDLRDRPATRTLTVAKPVCAPARGIIEPLLGKYGIKIYGYSESPKMVNPMQMLQREGKLIDEEALGRQSTFPVATVAKIMVSEKAAAWAEYLLIRSRRVWVVGNYIEQRNEQWALQHGGRMPPAWAEGKPWVEASCREGVNAWQKVKQAVKQARTPTVK